MALLIKGALTIITFGIKLPGKSHILSAFGVLTGQRVSSSRHSLSVLALGVLLD